MNGRQRNKYIRGLARAGVLHAFAAWVRADENLRRVKRMKAPEVIVAYFRRIEHDRAEAVRQAKGTGSLTDKMARVRTSLAADVGIELTPAEFAEKMHRTMKQVGGVFSGIGTPLPRDMLARYDLLAALMKKVGVLEENKNG